MLKQANGYVKLQLFNNFVQHLFPSPSVWLCSCAKRADLSLQPSVGVDGEGKFQAAQLLPTSTQDALKPVVAVSQPVGQIHVG